MIEPRPASDFDPDNDLIAQIQTSTNHGIDIAFSKMPGNSLSVTASMSHSDPAQQKHARQCMSNQEIERLPYPVRQQHLVRIIRDLERRLVALG